MRWFLRRLSFYALAIWVAVTLNFLLPRLMPGSPIGGLLARLTPAQIQSNPGIIETYQAMLGGGKKPILTDYFTYLHNVATLDFGISTSNYPSPVSEVIGRTLPYSIFLVGVAFLISFIFGITVGMFAAWRRGGLVDKFAIPSMLALAAFPAFFTSLLAVYFFGLRLGWFPIQHAYDSGVIPGYNWTFISSAFRHAELPMLVIVLVFAGGWALNMRTVMINTIGEDYVAMAHAKGLHDRRVMTRYAGRNAILPPLNGFANPQKNQYAYYLDGFDKGWNYIGNKHEVTYTNLNPGKYVFKVKGSNNDGIWNEEGVELQITIRPPLWKTWWFRLILYTTLGALIYMLYYLRLAFFQNQQKKLLLLVKERTLQLEEVAVALEEKQEEINAQNEELTSQGEELKDSNSILIEQKKQILEQNEELDKHRNQLETLVEERTRELIEAKNKAEESDRLKSSFLANLSHEIRTPLNAILGFASLLGEKDITDQEREEYTRIIEGSSNTLLDLISDILDISKIEAGQLELNLQEVSLESVLSDLVGVFDMFMKRDDIGTNKSVQLKVSIKDDIRNIHFITDHLRLTQVISNLINNAIKFTPQGYIEVGCTKLRDAEMLEFYVKDTGIGIKEENQQMVFERFRKVEEDKSKLHRGTGLGLAISHQLVNLLGGAMRLTSKVGEGSVFYFTLPLIRVDSSYQPELQHGKINATPDYKDRSILVAEDDMTNFNYIDKLLRMAKTKVFHANNGKQVLKIMQSEKDIRLILMDIKMPEMDGIEALHELRKLNINVPVIAQTAYALADEIVKLKKEGFNEYISKPIQRDSLFALISKYMD